MKNYMVSLDTPTARFYKNIADSVDKPIEEVLEESLTAVCKKIVYGVMIKEIKKEKKEFWKK